MTITRVRASEALSLITPELRALLVKDVSKSWPNLTEELGQRGVDQMVAFLVAGTLTDEPLTPSLRVDEFWHSFVLRTQPYGEFCQAVAGGIIHHVPDDGEGGVDPEAGRAAMELTKAAIREAGFTVDPEFWPGEGAADCTETPRMGAAACAQDPEMGAAECTQCHAGCHNSPKKV